LDCVLGDIKDFFFWLMHVNAMVSTLGETASQSHS